MTTLKSIAPTNITVTNATTVTMATTATTTTPTATTSEVTKETTKPTEVPSTTNAISTHDNSTGVEEAVKSGEMVRYYLYSYKLVQAKLLIHAYLR